MNAQIVVTCPECVVLGEGRMSDPATTARPPNWKGGGSPGSAWDRWAELDRIAELHTKNNPRHATTVTADPC